MTNLKVTEENTNYSATVEKEFEKSINLLPDETIEFKNRGIVFTGQLMKQSPGLVVLTNRRIIFLMHHFFGPDKLLYIPLNTISRMNFKNLGFLRGSRRAISLEYDNKSILFAITYVQKFMTGFGGPKETVHFFELLKEKLPNNIIDEAVISAKSWDYYLLLAGGVIGYFMSGIIGGVLLILLGAVLGFLIGKMINKLTK